MIIGLISDTHDFLDPWAIRVLAGVDFVLHAGDVGGPRLVMELQALAPTEVVLGNTDDLCFGYRERERVEIDGRSFLLQHIVDPSRWDTGLSRAIELQKPDFVIFGHTHKPFDQTIDGIRFINPGSAGKKRFSLPRTLGLLQGDTYTAFDLEAAGSDSGHSFVANLQNAFAEERWEPKPKACDVKEAPFDRPIESWRRIQRNQLDSAPHPRAQDEAMARLLLPAFLKAALSGDTKWIRQATDFLNGGAPERFRSLNPSQIRCAIHFMEWAVWLEGVSPSTRIALQTGLESHWRPLLRATEA